MLPGTVVPAARPKPGTEAGIDPPTQHVHIEAVQSFRSPYFCAALQLTRHISTAVWSVADKALYFSMVLVYFIPQKVIGESHWGLFTIVQAMVTIMYLFSDGFALQIMVNFGVREEIRRESFTVSVLLSTAFVGVVTTAVFFSRYLIADIADKPDLLPILTLFPLVALAFYVRSFTLKVSQLNIDTRGSFLIDGAWVGTTAIMLAIGWSTGWLQDGVDMMYISAISAGVSSVVGLLVYGKRIRFARKVESSLFRRMLRFGIGQFGFAATIALQSQGDLLILGGLVSAAAVGNYDVAKKFFKGFEGIRDSAILFIYPAVARLQTQGREQELSAMIEKMIAFMTIIIIPIVAVIWLAPIEVAFDWIYKGAYSDAPYLFRLMSLGAVAIPMGMTIYVLLGLSKVRKLFAVTFTSVIFFFAIALVLVPQIGVAGQAIAFATTFWVLGILGTLAIRNEISITPRGIVSRWRDPLEFARMLLDRIRKRGGGSA